MSLLSKCGLIFLTSITIMGLSTNETPLMDPSLSARELGLSKAAFTDHHFNHMLKSCNDRKKPKASPFMQMNF